MFHAGTNIARRWVDFQVFSEADRNYFDQLLPVVYVHPNHTPAQREVEPLPHTPAGLEVRGQPEGHQEEIPLLQDAAAIATTTCSKCIY